MNKKKRVSFRLDKEDVGIKVKIPDKNNLRRAEVDVHGTDRAGAAAYMEEMATKIRDDIHGRNGDEPEEEREGNIIDMEQWEVRQAPEGEPRIMVVGEYNEEVALFAKEWKYMDLEQPQTSAMPRPPEVKHLHDENCMRNFERTMGNVSLKPFINSWTDKCVIIVGSGPSLRKNKDYIPKDDPRFEVIAINEACAILDPDQIDFCFLADRDVGKHREWFSEELISTTPLICNAITSPDLVNEFEEVYFWRSNNLKNADDEKILRHVQHLEPLDVGQTATFSCFHFAYRTGAPYIMFAGQDFSCTSHLYSAGRKLIPEVARKQEFFLTEGMKEEVVLACPRLLRNMRILKGQAAFVGDDNRIVVNASGRGLLDLESEPNCNAEHFTPENNRNIPLQHAVEDAKTYISNGNKLEDSQEVFSCPTKTRKTTTHT